jgi:hypothetical protein
MPRRARQLSSTGIYRLMLRGINQQQMLEDREDNEKFLEILKDCKIITGFWWTYRSTLKKYPSSSIGSLLNLS